MKDARDKKIFEMWLSCHTQEEIAQACDCSQAEVSKSIPNGNIAEWNKKAETQASHLTDFDPPLYNVWKQQEKSSVFKRFEMVR